MANKPTEVPLAAGNLSDGLPYERTALQFIAASLSQNEEVEDFWIVTNPTKIDKLDDVVVRVSFKNSGKQDIALFVQVKHIKPDKPLWLKFNDQDKRPAPNCYSIKLTDFEESFRAVIGMMSSGRPKPETALQALLDGVGVLDYFVCIFTNTNTVYPNLQSKTFRRDHPIYFLDTQNRGQYRQFAHTNDFYKQLYVFLGQPMYKDINETIAQVLGEDSKKMPYLDKVIKDFMQRDLFCGVLTKQEFEMKLCEVLVNYWMVEVKNVDIITEKYTELWNNIFSGEEIINLHDDKIAGLLAYHYQCVIRKEVDGYFDWQSGVTKLTQTTKDCIQHKYSRNVTDLKDLLFLLWRENKTPLAIKSEYTPNILSFLAKFKTVKRKFVIFCSEDSPELKEYRSKESVITYVRQITDKETLENIFDLEVSLEGRPPVTLAKIAGVAIETAVEEIYKDLTISQVLAWTENEKNHTIGPQLRPPDDKYIKRNFTQKEEKQNELTETDVLQFSTTRLHIITGEPGLGKSTVLEALAHGYSPQNFRIYIILRDCLKDIENDAIWSRIQDNPITYFFNKMTNNTDDKITISIMEIHKTSERLCLFLDGFDEILPLHGERISSLLEIILNNTNIRIFCTTRPHAEHKISNSADAMCFELSPFDFRQITEFIAKTNMDKSIIWRFDFDFLGNPLHLHMLSQIYADQRKHDAITRGEMYRRFIELKHETSYITRKGFCQYDAQTHNRKSMKNHRVLAMVDIFGMDCVISKGLISQKKLDKIVKYIGNENIGIVVTNSSNSFQFVHRTFAEYFVADWLLHSIVQNDSNTEYLKHFHKEVWSKNAFINIKNIMKELTRNFDLWLEAIKYFFVNCDNENKSSTCTCDGFLGWLQCTMSPHPNVNGSTIVDSINRDYPSRTLLTKDDADTCIKLLTAIHAENEEAVRSIKLSKSLLDTGVGIVAFNLAITTGNDSVIKRLLGLRPELVTEHDVNGNTGLHISCAFGYSSIAALLFEKGANFGIVNTKGMTPLGMTTKNKQWGIWMMEQIGKISKGSGEHGHASPKYHNINEDLSKALLIASENFKWDIVKQLLEYDANPAVSNNYGWNAMHFAANRGNLQILEMLSERGHNINTKTNDGKTPLAIASGAGESDTVKWLLEHGADHTLSDEDGWTPTHFAAERGDLQILEILSERGHNINTKTSDGKTPLAIASDDAGESDTVKWLLEHGADPTLSDEDGWTPTHFAAERGDLQILEMLSERGHNINTKASDGKTPLAIASNAMKSATVNWLLKHGADPTLSGKAGWTLTHFAAQIGDLQTLEMLSERGHNINTKTNDGKTPLAIASDARESDTVKWLLEHGADPTLSDKAGWTPTHFAAQRGELRILEMLSERGYNINTKTSDGKTPLAIASEGWNSDTVKWLLEHGADPTLSDKAGWTPTHFAAQRGHLRILKMLSKRGHNINTKTSDGKTPLAIASDARESATVKWLLEHGADSTLSDKAGWTLTHFAAKRGDLQILKMLSERGHNINTKTNDDKTPLVIAFKEWKWDTVKWLLEHGADPTLSDKAGWTLTHFAAQAGDLQILEMLSERGHNINTKTSDGKTPLAIASYARESATVKWLLEHGADPTLSDIND